MYNRYAEQMNRFKAQGWNMLTQGLNILGTQFFWNVLLTIFTGLLLYVAWNEMRWNAASLSIGLIDFDKQAGFLVLPIKNNGKQTSGPISTELCEAHLCNNSILDHTCAKSVLPGAPPGDVAYKLAMSIPNWSPKYLQSILAGTFTVVVMGAFRYATYGFASATYPFCVQTISLKNGTSFTWAPCQESVDSQVRRALKGQP